VISFPPPYNVPTMGEDPTTHVRFVVMAARSLQKQELIRCWLTYLGTKDGQKMMRGTAKRKKLNVWAEVIIGSVIS
jgi:hypothetical protein